jgi:hypothetical protein
MPPYLLGLDAGSGSVRALLVDVESGRTTVAVRRWEHSPAPDGWGYDFDTDRNWGLLAEAVREALGRSGAAPTDVAGIAAASMRHSLVLVREGKVLFAVPNKDARAAAEGMEMAAREGDALAACTGCWPSPIFTAPRLAWLAAHHPEWLEGAVALSLSDWVAFRLCGVPGHRLLPGRGEPAPGRGPAGVDNGLADWSGPLPSAPPAPAAVGPVSGPADGARRRRPGAPAGGPRRRGRGGHPMRAAGPGRAGPRRRGHRRRDDGARPGRRRPARDRPGGPPLDRPARPAGPVGRGEQRGAAGGRAGLAGGPALPGFAPTGGPPGRGGGPGPARRRGHPLHFRRAGLQRPRAESAPREHHPLPLPERRRPGPPGRPLPGRPGGAGLRPAGQHRTGCGGRGAGCQPAAG